MKLHFHNLLLLVVITPLAVFAESEREVLGEEIKGLASDLSCEINAHCQTVGFGSRSCGGFSEYIIYSTEAASVEKMEALTEKHYKLDKQHNMENGGASICSIEMPRVSSCIYSKCVDLGDEGNAITSLHWAVEKRDVDLIDKLVSQGENIDIKGARLGDTPLQYAIRIELPFEIIMYLVDLGADVNASNFPLDESRNTPLHIAVSTKRYDLVKYLVSLGADKKAGGKFTPYYYADHYFKDHPKYNEVKEMLRPIIAGR